MANFLKSVLTTLLALIIFCGLGISGLLFLIIVGLRSSTPTVKDKSILVLDLALSLQDVEPEYSSADVARRSLTGDRESSTIARLSTVTRALEQASRDPRIVGLYLRGGVSSGSSGLANLLEARRALKQFRASGKPVIAYDAHWSEREYYLGSLATKLFINPLGTLTIDGYASENVFFAGTLKKYGVEVQVTRVGKYKSAVEPFLLTKNSPENQEQERQLLTDLWTEWVTSVAEHRQLTPQAVQAIADTQGMLLPHEALKQRLVDAVALPSEVNDELKRITGKTGDRDTVAQIDIQTYARATEDTSQASSKNRIAVLYAQGEIRNSQRATSTISAESFARQLRQLRRDKTVKAIVLRINSPGGSVTASEAIQAEVVQTREQKPVIVSMGNVAASGGYWIATYADRIFAEPTTITGSIGVYGLIPNIQKLANAQGITWDTVKTAKYADMDTISRPQTPEELALNQKLVDWIYSEFLSKVAESRKLPKAKVAEIAQGRVWSGSAAKKIGLVDEIGGLNQAIAAAAKQANLADWQVDEYPKNRGSLFQLLQEEDNTAQVQQIDPVTVKYQRLLEMLAIVQALDDPQHIYARLPFHMEIK
ncbi:MAG: signal peptide peptidase SppA [Cyanobacteria bacterium]|nr:signal peptide peptidase SppA [Cyanobacteriota bacterium]MDW8201007.1 signal peptide peptidase SppA [Cyanobacteriota bacterium SKYGB_h_bin112]